MYLPGRELEGHGELRRSTGCNMVGPPHPASCALKEGKGVPEASPHKPRLTPHNKRRLQDPSGWRYTRYHLRRDFAFYSK